MLLDIMLPKTFFLSIPQIHINEKAPTDSLPGLSSVTVLLESDTFGLICPSLSLLSLEGRGTFPTKDTIIYILFNSLV